MKTTQSTAIHAYIDTHKEETFEDYCALLRIPGISALRRYDEHSRRAAQFVYQMMRGAGLEHCEVIETDGLPLVYGDWLHAPGKPTVLLYAHYDVQPVDPVDEWAHDPFEPYIEGDLIYGRGVTDDKLQAVSVLHAIKAFLQTDGTLPVNVRVYYEGEEESGGRSVEKYTREHPEKLQSDIVILADGGLVAPNVPTMCYSCRGILYTEIIAKGAPQDLHSGGFGGNAPNPLFALAEIITGLKDTNGFIHIPGLYEMIAPISDEERLQWQKSAVYADTTFHNLLQADPIGEPDYTPIERAWGRPTLEVHGFIGGFQDEGSKTVIPALARVKVSLRLVPGQDPYQVFELLQNRVRQLTPAGVQTSLQLIDAGMPFLSDPESSAGLGIRRALTNLFASECVITRGGGSIPIATTLQQVLRAETFVVGFGLESDGAHAPNEHTSIATFYKSVHGFANILEELSYV